MEKSYQEMLDNLNAVVGDEHESHTAREHAIQTEVLTTLEAILTKLAAVEEAAEKKSSKK